MTSSTKIYGEWLVLRDQSVTRARHIATRREVELRGELHKDACREGRLLVELGELSPDFASLGAALSRAAMRPSVGAILRGSGWRVLFLELTGKCNERCLHCYAGSSPEVGEALSKEEIETALRFAKERSFRGVQFTGGDPLISPHLKFAIEKAHELLIGHIEVYTNALAFNKDIAEVFLKFGVSMAVSLYSHDASVHDAVTRTPGSHQRTSRAIRLALSSGIPVRIGGVQGVHEGQNEASLREYIVSLGVNENRVTVDRQRPVGRGQWNDATTLGQGAPQHSQKGDPEGGRLCVTYSGNVVPCIFDRSTVLGNIRTQSLGEILSTDLLPSNPSRNLRVAGEPLGCIQCRFRHERLHELRPEP